MRTPGGSPTRQEMNNSHLMRPFSKVLIKLLHVEDHEKNRPRYDLEILDS